MGRAIVKIKDKYFVWSSIVDAPITYGMTVAELKAWHKLEYGKSVDVEQRLKRVEERGTSYIDCRSVEEVIRMNRAGDNETCLTADEIYEKYVMEESESQ